MTATNDAPRAQTDRKTSSTFPEVTLGQPPTAWLQVLRNDSWDPASVRILTVHTDGQGVRLDSPIPLPRTTKVMVNITLRPSEALHVQGVVHSTRKNGRGGSVAVVRFEHQTETDRQTLATYATQAPAPEQPLEQSSDKRLHQRFDKTVAVQYQLLRTDGDIVPGEGRMMTLNIGGGGMRIEVEQPLESDDLLYLHLPLGDVPFFSLGRVAWVGQSPTAGRYVAGLQFVDLSETEQYRLLQALETVSA